MGGKFREITFGKSRTLDATIQIHGSHFYVFKWQGSLCSQASGTGLLTFTSLADLIAFLDEAL